jgi:hypothetical protein
MMSASQGLNGSEMGEPDDALPRPRYKIGDDQGQCTVRAEG